jgi:hypothetical protein
MVIFVKESLGKAMKNAVSLDGILCDIARLKIFCCQGCFIFAATSSSRR